MKTYEEVRKAGNLDAQDRAWVRHKIVARDKWLKEAAERKILEDTASGTSRDWVASAQAHADHLNTEIEEIVSRAASKMAMAKMGGLKVKRLEEKVHRLEQELIQARLELSKARPCFLCGKTADEGCKADRHPYTCDGTVS